MTSVHVPTLPTDVPPAHRSGFVAVVGRPNVGKSTLVNALVGEKIAIVSPKPQTTRNRLLGILTREDCQVIFMDTPGVHRPLHRLGEVMVDTAVATLSDADVAVWVVDVTARPNDEDRQVAARLAGAEDAGARGRTKQLPVILALNKVDRARPEHLQANADAYRALYPAADAVLISATRGDNLEALLAKLVAALPMGPRYYPEDEFTDQQVRFMAGELVREQVLRHLRDEVPHGVAVLVNEFKERDGAASAPGPAGDLAEPAESGDGAAGTTYISATIYVERETHKPILLGKGGAMLKAIGQDARQEIEKLLGTRVYLDLWVKVRPRWRMDEEQLQRLGYRRPGTQRGKGGARRKQDSRT